MNSDSYFDLLLFIIYISNHITTIHFMNMYGIQILIIIFFIYYT
jgi:hypothetical protein